MREWYDIGSSSSRCESPGYGLPHSPARVFKPRRIMRESALFYDVESDVTPRTLALPNIPPSPYAGAIIAAEFAIPTWTPSLE